MNGFFKIRIQLAQDHPASPPKGFFVTKIFHPNVSKNGEICVNTLKKDWTKDLGISQVLIVNETYFKFNLTHFYD